MSRLQLAVLGLAGVLAAASTAQAQTRPYIGFVYPAGGQQGTTFRVRLGGQAVEGADWAMVSGPGVSAKVVECHRRLNNEELTMLRDQVAELKRAVPAAKIASAVGATPGAGAMMGDGMMMDSPAAAVGTPAVTGPGQSPAELIPKIQERLDEFVDRPACNSIASLVIVEVTIAPDALPGPREIVVATPRGVSNPLVFHVGQLPEYSRKPMRTATLQVLGKEELALRTRPESEVEDLVAVPCTLNGQIASGEVNRYRFEAHKGQRLVIRAQARNLVPYIADAVPGWFQPVMWLSDDGGKEVAYDDDYRFQPDPTILFEVPRDGEYVLSITDAIYRGREDFVYRITLGEVPLVTSIFPLGGRVGEPASIEMLGWNLQAAEALPPPPDAAPGVHSLVARHGGAYSNPVPFALDTLPEVFDKEPNNDPAHAQKVELPVIVNGRIDRPGDWDVFQFAGRAGQAIVAEVLARRLDSPLDSILKLTDSRGRLLAVNDDHEDPEAGVNTHDADSYLLAILPADGTYYIHLGDTARQGGPEYGYRLRISEPRPDFSLFVVPSSLMIRGKSSAVINVQAIRKEGFTGSIQVRLADPPAGFSSSPVTLPRGQTIARLGVKTTLADTKPPVSLHVEGMAKIGGREVVHAAVPAEDRMQAFLWRHLVPAADLKALVFDPAYQPPAKRVLSTPPPPPPKAMVPVATLDPRGGKPKFTKQQVAGRLRQINGLFQEGLLTDNFANRRIAECEAVP